MDKVDKILAFDLTGPMAHFRKYFTNSSSLSYDFPPRTTVIGIVAGILGLERDSYYEDFGSEKCRIAVKIKEATRSIQRTVNYISVKNANELNGCAGHTQIPLEIILPKDLDEDKLCYRIYFWHENEDIMKGLYDRLVNKAFVYPVSLGLSEFLGNIENVYECNVVEIKKPLDFVNISTVCNLNNIEHRGLDVSTGEVTRQYIKEIAPVYFTADREDMLPGEFVYERNGKDIRAKLKSHYFSVQDIEVTENIVFMEDK
ncbi:MAG: type I-B CRISPR-associated protein Cas5b [Tepidanaerobacteraceae bacterium]|jgi:CRISPR-associated protein Cas5h